VAFPTRLQVKQLFWGIVDDPAGSVFTDVPNAITGAPSVFQTGFSQAFDLLFNAALNQQVPRVELVVQGLIVPPSPVPFSVTPASLGIQDLADWDWIAERQAGSNDKFIDLWDEDRLTQRAPTDRLLEVVWQNGAWNFVGCTTVRELQLKYVSSACAPTRDLAQITFDNSLNFLANYAAGVMAPNKGYPEIGQRALSFSVGPKFDQGSIGGELFRLMQPLVRSRQNVVVAHRPYSSQRRLGVNRAIPYVSSMAGTTGGSSANTPIQFSSSNGTIVGTIDGVNATLGIVNAVLPAYSVFRNGLLMTRGVDYVALGNQITFQPGAIPQPGDTITAEAFLLGQVQ
jgi:hypothetical protein